MRRKIVALHQNTAVVFGDRITALQTEKPTPMIKRTAVIDRANQPFTRSFKTNKPTIPVITAQIT
jgi:hypothetical protein